MNISFDKKIMFSQKYLKEETYLNFLGFISSHLFRKKTNFSPYAFIYRMTYLNF